MLEKEGFDQYESSFYNTFEFQDYYYCMVKIDIKLAFRNTLLPMSIIYH